ncbi:Gfo/Idh/MocA family protein [Brenneria izbisi]|uniref:Gfo/Idh/MocA family oxidoreductase n=1 Tax=Brenneria izbisi TaxID=2939450 RepID=A0AA41XX87_9GAMM|nr:Gfo/Idh/MocA family oxidoreductase [Brenneria izbisi]MCV9878276.1 Gfo/Idh/MocA family oxidoreductase [Brenneria izbisi]MCV9881699.1 Gfo/Idh/MocA family oxidoreductase [Brenneria izbisi]
MTKLRIGVVGLGGIAQKAWLPVLSAASDWLLEGAFSPTRDKALPICNAYRIPYVSSLHELARRCDAVFVHSATSSHYAVVSELLRAGVHVCVDKPLAERLDEAEQLVELAEDKKLSLMVGFNRRFSPLYQALKARAGMMASLRMDKHRNNSVGPQDCRFTLLDDYLHVVDTALWLAGGRVDLQSGNIFTTEKGEMFYAEHHFAHKNLQVTTSMHRRAGGQREWVQAILDGALIQVNGMREWCEDNGKGTVIRPAPDWQSTLEQRGFVGCVRHFVDCVQNQTAPETSGEQALAAQRMVETLLGERV